MHSEHIWCHSIYSFNMGRWNGWCYLRFPHRPLLLLCGKYIHFNHSLSLSVCRSLSRNHHSAVLIALQFPLSIPLPNSLLCQRAYLLFSLFIPLCAEKKTRIFAFFFLMEMFPTDFKGKTGNSFAFPWHAPLFECLPTRAHSQLTNVIYQFNGLYNLITICWDSINAHIVRSVWHKPFPHRGLTSQQIKRIWMHRQFCRTLLHTPPPPGHNSAMQMLCVSEWPTQCTRVRSQKLGEKNWRVYSIGWNKSQREFTMRCEYHSNLINSAQQSLYIFDDGYHW